MLRTVARHRLRSALAVLAVALGVAAFLATAAVGDSVERTATAALQAVSGGADLGIDAADAGVPAAWTARVRDVAGVEAAAPVVFGWAALDGATRGRALVVGVDPAAEARMRRREAPPGARPEALFAFAAGAAAFLSRPLADEIGAAPGGAVTLRTPSGPLRLAVAGVLEPRAAERAVGGRTVVASLAAASRVLGRAGAVDRIDVRLAEGADAGETAARVRAAIGADAPPNLRVGPPQTSDPAVSDTLGVVKVALRIGAAVALLIGMFLVHHTVSVGVAERRREAGLLRALGATRTQVRGVFVAEAALLGLAGSVLGVLLAMALAAGALRGFAGAIASAYFAGEPAPARISWSLGAAGVALGLTVALAAAWRTATRAAWEPPTDAIRRAPEEGARSPFARGRLLRAGALAAASGVLVLAPEVLGRWTGYAAAVLALLAYLAAAPAVLAVGARALAPLLARRFGVPGRLAADQLAAHPVRAALPAAALAVGLALVVETAGTTQTLSETTLRWMDEQIAGDLFVSSGRVVMGAGGHTPLDESAGRALAEVPGVAEVVPVRFRYVEVRGARVLVWAFDMEPFRRVTRVTIHGDASRDEVLREVQAGGACVASENLLRLQGLAVGDVIELPGARRMVPLRIAGAFDDYSWPRGALIVDRGVLAREFDDRLLDEFSVKLAPGADADAVRRAIASRLGEERAVVVTSARELQAAARALLEDFFALSYAQLAAALAVAFLGVVNSLWISVLLRRREIALLRAVGATRGQVTRSFVLEAAGLGVIGAACGLFGGALVEWLALRRVLPADTGWVLPMDYPWTVAALTAVLGVAVSALAGLVPAGAAARLPLVESMADE